MSWVELMLSYMYTTRIMFPIKRQLPNGTEYLQKLDDWETAQVFSPGLGEQTNNFMNLILQVR